MKNLKLEMNNLLPLRDVVFNTLRKAILEGELEPGERLMEIALANRLGVSRTPIREAMRMLELEGLVVMIPRKGAQVASITAQDLQDVLEVRTSLEVLAVELACDRITHIQLAELDEALNAFEKAVMGGHLTEIADRDVAFHDIIFAGAHNARLVQILNNLREQMYRYRLEYLKDRSRHTNLIEEHRQLAEAIRAQDRKAAVKIIKEHIYNQEISIMKEL